MLSFPGASDIACEERDPNCNVKDRLGKDATGKCIKREIVNIKNTRDKEFIALLEDDPTL